MKARREPLEVEITSDGKRIGALTAAEFMQSMNRPRAFLPALVTEFNAMKEREGEPERAAVKLMRRGSNVKRKKNSEHKILKSTRTNPVTRKKRRTAKQIAATKKLVAFNKKRRSKKKAARKPTRRRTTNPARKKATRRKSSRAKRSRTAASGYFQIFKCRGNDVRFLALTTDGHIRWTLTRGDTVRWQSKAEAARIARRIAKGRKLAGYYVGVAGSNTSATAIRDECVGAQIVGKM